MCKNNTHGVLTQKIPILCNFILESGVCGWFPYGCEKRSSLIGAALKIATLEIAVRNGKKENGLLHELTAPRAANVFIQHFPLGWLVSIVVRFISFFFLTWTDQMFDLSFQLSKHLLKLENKVLFTVTRLCKLLYFVISSFRSLLVDYEKEHLKEEVLLKSQSFRIKIWTSLFRNIMYHFLWSYSVLVQCSSSINASSVIVCFTFTCEVTYVTKNSINKYLVLA